MKRKNQGFSLVEMLISVGILGIVTVSVLNLQSNTRQVTSMITAQNTIQEDLRVAAAIMADEIQRAYYIFPPCGAYSAGSAPSLYACGAAFDSLVYVSGKANVNFSSFKLASSGTRTLRPDRTTGASDARTWTVSDYATNPDAPILAMIVAPSDPVDPCGTGSSPQCYTFVAYYPVLRKSVVGASSTQLEGLADNDNMWVLMEYRQVLKTNIAAVSVSVPGFGSLYIPSTNWKDVGITTGAPSLNPSETIQTVDGNLPALYRGAFSLSALGIFTGKMSQTATTIGGGVTAQILADNINPRGFRTYFPQESIDERGVTEVRIQLQAGIKSGSTTTIFPPTPLEIYASPRNIPAGFTGK